MQRNYMIDCIKYFVIFSMVAIYTKTVQGAQLGMMDDDEANFIMNTFDRCISICTRTNVFFQKMYDIFTKNTILSHS